MSVYDAALFSVTRLVGARLGTEFTLGTSHLGAADSRIPLATVTAVTLNDGYTVGQFGELSLDPGIATLVAADKPADPVAVGALPLAVNDRVQLEYDGVILLAGSVTGITVDIGPLPFGQHTRRVTYTVASRESTLLSTSVFWTSLPSEDALTRAQRWLTIDTSAITPAHLAARNVTVPADDSGFGAQTLAEAARSFSASTGLPLRMLRPTDPTSEVLAVYDSALSWSDQVVTAAPGMTTSADWTNNVRYATRPGSTVIAPESVTVIGDDTRLAGGQLDVEAMVPGTLGATFKLGSSRLGTSGYAQSGFGPGMAVDVFGTVMIASRVVQTFTPLSYHAQIELTPPLVGS